MIVSLTPGVFHASCAAFLIVLTGFTAERPSLRSEPICCDTYIRPPTSFVARLRTYSVVAILSDLSPSRGVIDLGNTPDSGDELYSYSVGSFTRKPICLNCTSPFNNIPSVCSGADAAVCPVFNA